MPEPENPDLRKLFEVWMDDRKKILITVFFQENPGVVESVEGLAKRLGTTSEDIREAIADHLSLGLLKERTISGKKVLVYDRSKRRDLEEFIAEELQKRMEGDPE